MIYLLKTKDRKYVDQFLINAENEKELLEKVEDFFSGIKASLQESVIALKGVDESVSEEQGQKILEEANFDLDKLTVEHFIRFNEKGVILFEVTKINSLDQLTQIIDPGKELGSIE